MHTTKENGAAEGVRGGVKKIYFISGGGTGGHIYPALAIAKALKEAGDEVIFIGNAKNLEYKICVENEIEFLSVDVNYMPRKFEWFGLKFLFWALKTFAAACVAASYIKKHKPAAVFATGGYVSAPVLIASVFLKIPYMAHEADVYPGLVSRFFSKWTSAVSIAFDEAREKLKARNIYHFGNPVREVFFKTDKEASREKMGFKSGPQVLLGGARKPVLLIMGGSQGAKTLNWAAIHVIKHFAKSDKLNIILQTGAKNYDDLLATFGKPPDNAVVMPYFDDMSIPLGSADLVVARAGSLSISEICAVGVPSILVPYPYAAMDHQRLNSKVVESLGASIILDDADCMGETLLKLVNDTIFDEGKLRQMRIAAKDFAKPDATKNILEKLKEISR